MSKITVGLLPLYVQFYDEILPSLFGELEPFVARVAAVLSLGGLEVITAPTGRTQPDFAAAVRKFEADGVDAIVTLHLAYSPSLEAADALARTELPLVMFNTTPDREFGRDVNPMRLLANHGIHGVQDLASVLRQRGKTYRVVAGHLDDAAVVPRCVSAVRAARAARCFGTMRVLRIGGVFPGMGDFAVPDQELSRTLGVSVENIEPDCLAGAAAAIKPDAVAAEMAEDRARYRVDCAEETHARSVRLGLGLRQFLEQGGYGAFTMNFLSFTTDAEPVSTVPFLESCKGMERGLGYAGEGDALTAALVGSLSQGFGETTFAEIFCADWAGESLFLSHMGEINPAVAASRPLLYEKDYPFTAALNPATLACAPREGAGTLVNLAPGPRGTFRLIVARVQVLGDGVHPDYERWVRGWIRPPIPLVQFLEEFSHLGGTHHSALMLGDHCSAMEAFGQFLGLEVCIIQ
jgi:L-arabinose isomerase